MPRNFGASLEDDVERVLFNDEQLRQKCCELGRMISQDYVGKAPLVVGVLNGAMVFMADLLRQITIPLELDTLSVASYGQGATSGELRFRKDVDADVAGKHIIFVEDIVDTGKTLKKVLEVFSSRGAASVAICTLLDKKARREVDGLELKYVGYECPDEFVVGYGIDYAERYRNLPYVAALK
eukprot:CAMPEP_0178406668 /NCGR_PEP_ID=MMETSP0689_2-20121128/19031_1 /TAXON_ID=160604 /ORGANISM="Amphidinium massartii, Strain CS-259" /LENGTH=181 /DNA_ID=CAMNT_0020027717 /DNA_START=54 /DNA_END=596 /DNA_ORIENTATION=-